MSGFVPTYRSTGSPLHGARASVAAAYVAAPCVLVLFFDNPVILGAALAAVIGAGLAAGLGSELKRAARLALPIALLVALVNPIVSREGLTVLAEGPTVPVLGQLDITAEALTYGGVAALRVLVVTLAFGLYSAAVDPDELLRLFRRLSLRSALTASLATRLVPVLGRDAGRLADAYTLRAARPSERGRFGRLRRGAVLTRALAAGALERSVDIAAALEVRGYTTRSRRRGRSTPTPWSRHDLAFAASAMAIVTLSIAGSLAGLAAFDPYPTVRADLGFATGGLAVGVVTSMFAPFVAAAIWRAHRARLDGRSPLAATGGGVLR
jgi:energy-coupling factor transport system permease protein